MKLNKKENKTKTKLDQCLKDKLKRTKSPWSSIWPHQLDSKYGYN